MEQFQMLDPIVINMHTKEMNLNRRLHMNEEFNEDSCFKLRYGLDKIKKIDDCKKIPMAERQPIWIVINSYGGHAYELLATLGKIESFKDMGYVINTLVTGKAMSCGFFLALSGTNKYAHRFATFMCHGVSSGTYGTVTNMQDDVNQSRKLSDIVFDYTISHSGITMEDITSMNNRDWFIDVEKALELKVIDEVI